MLFSCTEDPVNAVYVSFKGASGMHPLSPRDRASLATCPIALSYDQIVREIRISGKAACWVQ